MNSEELEQSLRTEFENYLNDTFGDMRNELTELQAKVTAEIEKHKVQLETVFQDAMNRVSAHRELDSGFKDSVLEHMRLARDEGASITAKAIAEAEEMDRQNEGSKYGFAELREAISDISSKNSQSEILKSLVNQAEMFAPRGAFFIVKNEHFVGWKTFGAEKGDTEETVRDIFFPVSSDSILSQATRLLTTVEGNSGPSAKDAEFLSKLGFDSPEKMYAIPLVARGRGVAVLYADKGEKDAHLDTDALETLVRVASLTVEVLASAKTSHKKKTSSVISDVSETGFAIPTPAISETGFAIPSATNYEQSYREQSSYQSSFDSQPSYQAGYQTEPAVQQNFDSYNSAKEESYYAPPVTDYMPPVSEETFSESESAGEDTYQISYDENSWQQAEADLKVYEPSYTEEPVSEPEVSNEYSYQQPEEPMLPPVVEAKNEYKFEKPTAFEESETESFESYTPPAQQQPASSFDFQAKESKAENTYEFAQEQTPAPPPVQPAPPVQSTPPARSRFSDRNVDLPIEVTEDERRLHNDARRFARLLVSEIKLYNEAKVKEGRESSDLYDRLREAIDRSREMYDKRVQPNVAAKFDYFHYELVNSLGEGDTSKLGTTYPGATV